MRLKNIFETPGLRKTLVTVAWVGLGFIIGILVLRIKAFQFEWKFDVFDILNLIVTLIVAAVLQQVLVARASDDRIEKDLIIAQTKVVIARVEKLAELCKESANGTLTSESARTVLPDFRFLNNELSSLEQHLKLTPIRLELDRFKRIKSGCLRFKRMVTGGTFPTSPLSLLEYTRIYSLKRNLSDQLVSFIFYLNRL